MALWYWKHFLILIEISAVVYNYQPPPLSLHPCCPFLSFFLLLSPFFTFTQWLLYKIWLPILASSTLWDFLWTTSRWPSFISLNFLHKTLKHVFYFDAFYFHGILYIFISCIWLTSGNTLLLFLQKGFSPSVVLFACNKTDWMAVMRQI